MEVADRDHLQARAPPVALALTDAPLRGTVAAPPLRLGAPQAQQQQLAAELPPLVAWGSWGAGSGSAVTG